MQPDAIARPDDDHAFQRQRLAAARANHWRRTRRVTNLMLLLWLVTGFCTVFYARDLAQLHLFGWPFSFYMAAQGASLIYLGIIGGYAWRMRQVDRQFRQESGEPA
ncbi:MAG TPA: DUF4212 domain-containing protein [Telluria sp.]|nr:DUF4212 domain-containing protein [Telluria sp.]